MNLKFLAALVLSVLIFCCPPAWADSQSSFGQWSLRSIQTEGSTLTVSLNQDQVDDVTYIAVILEGFCDPVEAGNTEFLGIREVKILNKWSYQGYAFEGGEASCTGLKEASQNERFWGVLGKTHSVMGDL